MNDNRSIKMAKIVIDPGHGGNDSGATYKGRREKDDVLRLGLEVGKLLQRNGEDVYYTRVSDTYNTPLEKAEMGNKVNADFFYPYIEIVQILLIRQMEQGQRFMRYLD